MKLLADVNVAVSTVQALRAQGSDVLALGEVGLHRLEDAAILARAASEERTVVTFDRRFNTALAFSGAARPSVVVLDLPDQTPRNATPKLLEALARHSRELTQGAIVIVEESRTRVRRLPLER